MEQSGTNLIAKKVCWYEAIAIFFIIAVTWIDEILDIPYLLLSGPATPINWRESLFESIIIAAIAAVIIRHTYKLLTRISYLESILPVCASCKKIRMDPAFLNDIKQFVDQRAEKDFTYGICPDCIKTYYPELQRKNTAPINGAE
jgi:hypothetical protein